MFALGSSSLSGAGRAVELVVLKRLFAFQNYQRLLGYWRSSELRSSALRPIDRRTQAEVVSARRSDTAACFRQEGVSNSQLITDLAGEDASPSAVGGRTLSVRPQELRESIP